MTDLQMTARREFSDLPKKARRSPARTRNLQVRFYIDRYGEHRRAYDLLADQPRGEGPKLIIRALLHYRDTVSLPLAGLKRDEEVPAELRIGVLDFVPLDCSGNRVKAVSMRLYVDRFVEHREASDFLARLQDQRRDSNKETIRALIHYEATVLAPLARGEGR